jgi:hypothetical protein
MFDNKLLELHTRVLLVFSWDVRKTPLQEIFKSFQTLELRDKNVWNAAEPPGSYRSEFLSFVQQFFFGAESPVAASSSSVYLRLDANLHDQIFGKFLAVDFDRVSNRKEQRPSVKAFCRSNPGVELFLTPSGAGALSLSFYVGNPDTATIEFDEAREFNYAVSQRGRRNIPLFRRPHPELDLHLFDPGTQARDPIPTDDALEGRIGRFGGSFSLEELAERLIAPLLAADGFRFFQQQNSIYTVAVLAAGHPVELEESQPTLSDFLAALGQVEEPRHPGTKIAIARYHSRHWAVTSSLASAHLVSLQGVQFDEQRASGIRDKYFLCYLIPLLQRSTIYRMQVEAAKIIDTIPHHSGDFAVLRKDALRFSLAENWTEISSREVINRFYEQCREALRIVPNMAAVGAAIGEFDAAERAAGQHEALQGLERTQNKLEWIEILIVGIYIAEFLNVVGEILHLPDKLLLASIVAGALPGMRLAHWVLRPSQTGEDSELPARRNRAIISGLLCFVVWLCSVVVWGEKEATDLSTWLRSLDGRYQRVAASFSQSGAQSGPLRRAEVTLTQAAVELSGHRLEPAREMIERADELVRELEVPGKGD